MPEKGWKIVPVREEIYNQMKLRFVKETSKLKYPPKFTRWFNEFLLDALKEQ